jgi:hypothetical protein
MPSRYKRLLQTFLLSSIFAGAGLQAHHSLVGEFDTSVDIDVTGAITKLEWSNPHIWLYMDVTNEDGEVEQWECEMGSPNQLFRLGWREEDLPLGTVIIAQANPARDGTNTCSTRNITLEDGTPVFSRTGNR